MKVLSRYVVAMWQFFLVVAKKIIDSTELISKWVTISAIIAGGIWAYYNFLIVDYKLPNAQITLSTEVIDTGGDLRLLVVHIKPTNIGKVPIEIKSDGLSLSLRKIPSGNGKSEQINLDEIKPVFEKKDLLKRYESYLMEPAVMYDEVALFYLPKGDTYAIEANLDLGETGEVGAFDFVKIN
ncbi:hypothetical protein ACO0K0_12115 [Undibacterium sp. SXout11W]|uniref:hypothetical protein n=1 Tax=Undibacterium sp. SXout11W TaxID=3413050 RepID=UPI003BF197BE